MIKVIKKYLLDRNIRSGIFFSFFSIINSGLNFLLLFLLANYLEADEYGHLTLYNNYITIVTIFSSLGTSGYISVAYFKQNGYFPNFVSSICLISFVVIISFFIICSFRCVQNLLGLNSFVVYIGLIYCFCQFYTSLLLDYRRLKEEVWKYGTLTSCIAILNLILIIVLIKRFPIWQMRVITQVSVSIIVYAYCILLLYKSNLIGFSKINKKCIKESLLFGLPIVPHLLTVWLRQGLDAYIINYYHTPSILAYYSFALNFYSIIYIIGSAFNNSNSVYIYKLLSTGYNDNNKRKFISYNKKIMCFFMMMTIFIIVVTLFLIPIIFPKYENSLKYIIPLCLAGFFQIIYLLYVNVLFYYSKTKLLMYVTFSLSVVYAIGSFFITRYSLLHLSFWLLFINMLIAILVMFFSKKELLLHYKDVSSVS